MDLAQRWVSGCLRSHPGCKVERQPCYPSRLLCIASDPLQLAITTDWTQRPLYATLSHCWGTRQFETLQTTNLDQLRRAVPGRFLSKVFLDAVQIARAAGFIYLWIDSLCIIQDSQEDWQMEASMMASVYGGSSLNIAASSAKDGTEGCFLKPLHHFGGFTARVCINGRIELFDVSTRDVYKNNVTWSHLATRAWAAQEKVLPPRTLHCGDQGFFWECKTQFASEYFPHGFCEAHPYLRYHSLMLRDSNLLYYWRRLKEWYTKCDLTKPQDKLIALSGVVQAIRGKTGDQYFAGLWRRTLDQELCWRAIDIRERPEYRAPSWSWAAVDGPVMSKLITSKVLGIGFVQVRSVSAIHPGSNVFGNVLHGTLSLLCHLILEGSIAAEDVARTKRKPYSIRHSVNPDGERGTCFSEVGQEGFVLPFLLDCIEQKDSRLGQTIYFLPLRGGGNGCHSSGNGDSWIPDERVFGIVLEKVPGSSERFRRIGCFEYSTPLSFIFDDDDNKQSFPEDYDYFIELCCGRLSSNSGSQTINIF